MSVVIVVERSYMGDIKTQSLDYIGVWEGNEAFNENAGGYWVVQGTVIPDWECTGVVLYDPITDLHYEEIVHDGLWHDGGQS